MKITNTNLEFQPFNIVIESPGELALLVVLLGELPDSITNLFGIKNSAENYNLLLRYSQHNNIDISSYPTLKIRQG